MNNLLHIPTSTKSRYRKRRLALGVAVFVISLSLLAVTGCAFLGASFEPNAQTTHYSGLLPSKLQTVPPALAVVQEQVRLSVPKTIQVSKKTTVTGTLTPLAPTAAKTEVVSIQKKTHGRWSQDGKDAHVLVNTQRAHGHFHVSIALNQTGIVGLRAKVASLHQAMPVAGVSDVKLAHVTAPPMYASQASFYTDVGLGLACGGTMGSDTLGVANKTLPCGTLVTIQYHGITITVPVIDRGPFVADRNFDLSSAVVVALHFNTSKGVDTIYTNPAG